METFNDPLTSKPPVEVHLSSAPLVRVIAQVCFPQVLSIGSRDFVAPFQERIRDRYPVLRTEHAGRVTFTSHDASAGSPQIIWRFGDIEGHWRVSLARNFLTIETTAYESRKDFFERFQIVIDVLADIVAPQLVDRIGVRYIDRITGDGFNKLGKLIRPEVLGVTASTLARHARLGLCENVFSVPDTNADLLARWGLLPAGKTIDPATIELLDEQSWILDLDMYEAESTAFDPSQIAKDARIYAERIYAFFRWVVTDDFLQFYGGKL